MICYFTHRLLDVTKSEICARSLTSNLEDTEENIKPKSKSISPRRTRRYTEESINNGVLRKMMDLFCTIRTVNLLTLSNRRGRRGQKAEGEGPG